MIIAQITGSIELDMAIVCRGEGSGTRFLSCKKVVLLPLQALWLLIFTFPLSAPIWFFIIWLSLR
jgi:hypothetical protein